MKRTLSIIMALVLIVTALAAAPVVTAVAGESFHEGDVLYLRVENPSNWADDCVLYANFTACSREDNGGSSVIIADADKSMYDPVTGVEYDSARGLYKYTVTAADEGATDMRFWRGSAEKLWNCSVVISGLDCYEGRNTVVVTDWTDTGYLDSTYEFDLGAKIELSETKVEPGTKVAIDVRYNANKSANTAVTLYINDEKVADTDHYDFTPKEDGIYTVRAELVATHFNTGALMSKATATAAITVGTSPVYVATTSGLYAHASRGSKDMEAWVRWYGIDGTYYFFLPSSVHPGEPVELYSSYNEDSELDGIKFPGGSTLDFKPEEGKEYLFRVGRTTRYVRFMYSDAESALFVNNLEDFDGEDFFTYLKQDKENYVAATGAYTHTNGTVTDVEIKKMKGRGNTSWNADKKGFNVTFKDAITLDGMEKCKKFSLISNFQDAAMLRSRILYDLSDAVEIPYASDSRMIDLYTNGVYQGAYQMCQKVDVGKNTLMPDIDDEDYLDTETGGVQAAFSFVAEIDSSPSDDDFHFSVQNGNNLTMKSPEMAADDPNTPAVRGYIKNKFNTMFSKLSSGAFDLNDYIDLDSLAKVYIINELGKNWDSGATSFFLTYKPDDNGVYKFFASPVWDYDNSLGNANGIERDLQRMGVTDYTLPTGWFATKKNGYNGPNFLAEAAKKSVVMEKVYKVWFEDFVPALEVLNKTDVHTGELWSADVYRKITKASAEMNYKIWELVTDTSWIADHSALQNWGVAYTYNEYGQIIGADAQPFRSVEQYDQYTYDGQFDYMLDWLNSRAAWISGQYISHYTPEERTDPTEPPTEAPTEPPTEAPTEPPVVPYPAPAIDRDHLIAAWSFDDKDKTEGEKLSEYGSADDGYAATIGTGMLTLSVDGEKGRALEWSAAEYGPSGKSLTPLMAAGSKNLWGSPYIRMKVNTEGLSDITLTMYLAGSNKAPASWKLQYSTDGAAYTDVPGATVTITADQRKVLTAYLDGAALPEQAGGQSELYLQLVPVSMDTIGGGNTADKPSGGEIALNYISIHGLPADTGKDILGDVNLNGEIDILDATLIQRHLAAIKLLTPRQLAVADTGRDGEVDIIDATLIQRYLAAIITSF